MANYSYISNSGQNSAKNTTERNRNKTVLEIICFVFKTVSWLTFNSVLMIFTDGLNKKWALSLGWLLGGFLPDLVTYLSPKTLWVKTHSRNICYFLNTELYFLWETDVFSLLTGPIYSFLKLPRHLVPNSMFKYRHVESQWSMYCYFFSINLHLIFVKKKILNSIHFY